MSSNTLWCFFLILSITKVCQGQLMCYVCDNCDKVTDEIPQFECNEDFFNKGGTTESSVQTTTTTEPTATEESTIGEFTTDTTTNMVNETTMDTSNENSTTEMSTETTMEMSTTTTTQPQPPTPPTVGPPMTTTALPTPPNPGNITQIDNVENLNNQATVQEEQVDEVDAFDVEKVTIKAYKPSAEFRVRQLRSASDFTYHCFKVHATAVNGTEVINRGCSRVQTMESVCGQWEAQHPNEHIDKCYPCTRPKCNGSSALSVSITALLMAVIAVFMHQK